MHSRGHHRSWTELLRARASEQPDRVAFTHLRRNNSVADAMSYSELDRRARAIGAGLADQLGRLSGERLVIALPSGNAYISAFFGVLYAGGIPVTAYPPPSTRNLARLRSIANDCSPIATLSDAPTLDILAGAGELAGRAGRLLPVDDLLLEAPTADFHVHDGEPDDLALLQYTSGSTSDPKGVMVSHANLFHNCELLREGMAFDSESVVASWLPLHHDMGLIGKILVSVYCGVPCYYISPLTFVKSPYLWLKMISDYRCTISGAPNFAYDLCVRRVDEAQRASLDLSSWAVAWNGAEPVRAETLAEFRRAFAPFGLRPSAPRPCYGLAEGTLFVTSRSGAGRELLQVDREALSRGLVREASSSSGAAHYCVSVGQPRCDAIIKIVDPGTCAECAPNSLGELWTSSSSVARGYWCRPAESEAVFRAQIAGSVDGLRYLRTGDLAFRAGGEHFIAGRIKDILIVNGRNVYPQDVEASIERVASPVKRSVVVSSDDTDLDTTTLAVCELERAWVGRPPDDFRALVSRIVAALHEEHDFVPRRVVLVRPSFIALTTSGKVQRRATRDALQGGDVPPLFVWDRLGPERQRAADDSAALPEDVSDASVAAELKTTLASVLGVASHTLTGDHRVAELGLDSLKAVEFLRRLQPRLMRPVGLEQLFTGNPTLSTLLKRLWPHVADSEAARAFPPSAPRAGAGLGPRRVADKYQQKVHNREHPFVRALNPEFGRRLSQLKLDKEFVRAQGCHLFDADGRRYLDFLSQYGAVPLGHNHPEIWRALLDFHENSEAALVQPSFQVHASRLAARLVELAPAGIAYATFCGSGAEAVEAALKLARSTTGRSRVLATRSGFHGKTLGALSATGREKYRRHFGVVRAEFDHVPFNDQDALRAALAQHEYACFIVEPIQGEAGVIVGTREYLRAAQELCRSAGTLLILDEVQTGLGRTGHVYAAEHYGLEPDIITLAKGLGGGLLPIGACLSGRYVYNDEFGSKHTSTFAGNGLACAVACKFVDLLTRDDGALLEGVHEMGGRLERGLRRLQDEFPHLIREVRGKGLMLGLHLGIDRYRFGSGLLASIAEEEFLTSLLMSYMLNIEGVRTAFTLNDGNVLRIQPPLNVTWEECEVFLAALRRTLSVLSERHMGRLVRHLVEGEVGPASEVEEEDFVRPVRDDVQATFGFVLHPMTPETYVHFDRSLSAYSAVQLEHLGAVFGDNFEPFLGGEGQLVSKVGTTVTGEFWVLPRTARDLMAMPREQALAEVQEALDFALLSKPEFVGLGAYTCTVSQGGLLLNAPPGVTLTTGNSFTAIVGFLSVIEAISRRGLALDDISVTVLGATGSVGRALSLLFGPFVNRLVLVGNDQRPKASEARLESVRDEIEHNARDIRALVVASKRLLPAGFDPRRVAQRDDVAQRVSFQTSWASAVRGAHVVVTVTNSPDAALQPGWLDDDAIICDISRPSNVAPDLRAKRPDVFVYDGGVVTLPAGMRLGMKTDLDHPTHCYACMAETMLLALEGRRDLANLGQDVGVGNMFLLLELAAKHGFAVYVPSSSARTAAAGADAFHHGAEALEP